MQLMTTLIADLWPGWHIIWVHGNWAGIIRVGNGIPQLQWDSIRTVKPTFCMVVPSFLLKLIEYAEHNDIDYNASSIKRPFALVKVFEILIFRLIRWAIVFKKME